MVEQTVIISDGDTLVGGIPSEYGNSSGTLTCTLTCIIAAGDNVMLTVQRSVGETCEGFTVTDNATATVGGSHIQGSPSGDIGITIPANESLCTTLVSTPTPTSTPPPTPTAIPTVIFGDTPEGIVEEATPRPPSTGAGTSAAPSTFSFMFIVLALLALSAALGAWSMRSGGSTKPIAETISADWFRGQRGSDKSGQGPDAK